MGRDHRRHGHPARRLPHRSGLDVQHPCGSDGDHPPLGGSGRRLQRPRHPGGVAGDASPCRNLGTKGLVMQALSAVDIAWWDLKACLLDSPLAALLGSCPPPSPSMARAASPPSPTAARGPDRGVAGARVPRDEDQDRAGCGTERQRDLQGWPATRVAGDAVNLMVDANGGYTVAQARRVGAISTTWGFAGSRSRQQR